jgi:hypothetical protein
LVNRGRKKRNIAKRRVEQKAVLIALEDTKSAKYYFDTLLKDKKLRGEVIIAKHLGSNPKRVLEALNRHKKRNNKQKFEKEWIVVDRDEWKESEFSGTIKDAKKSGICVSFSNEAYELWLLLHFERVEDSIGRKDLKKRVDEYFQKYFKKSYLKSSSDVYNLLIGYQKEALKNAKYLVDLHIKNDGKIYPHKQNPLTMIYQLIVCLNTLYDDEQKCDCYPLKIL